MQNRRWVLRRVRHAPVVLGGGWLIKDLSVRSIDVKGVVGETLEVNRLVIKKGDYTQIVYYWFKQRDRNISSEWLVKWFLFWDGMTRNRIDGALVRLTTLVMPGEDVANVDEWLLRFADAVVPRISDYIPDW